MRIAPLAVAALIACAPPLLAQTPDANGNLATPTLQPSENAPPAAQPAETAPPVPVKPSQPAPMPPARFSFSRVENGLLRLDTQTGQVALCSARSVGWACEAVPEERAALEKEIARLQDEVDRPQARARGPAAAAATAAAGAGARHQREKAVCSVADEDVARARAYVEEAWRRLVEMLMNFQKDVMRKS